MEWGTIIKQPSYFPIKLAVIIAAVRIYFDVNLLWHFLHGRSSKWLQSLQRKLRNATEFNFCILTFCSLSRSAASESHGMFIHQNNHLIVHSLDRWTSFFCWKEFREFGTIQNTQCPKTKYYTGSIENTRPI